MEQLQILRIVAASPADVQAERDALEAVADELNRGIAAVAGLRIEISRWETDAYPGFHPEGPQGRIDSLLKIEDCDVLIGIFWKDFGKPTRDAESSTEHEFRIAYEAWKKNRRPEIMVYFNQRAYAAKSSAEAEQWRKVLEFQENFPKEGLWWPYNGKSDFERLVRDHLTQFIRQRYFTPLTPPGPANAAAGAATPSQAPPPDPVPSPTAEAPDDEEALGRESIPRILFDVEPEPDGEWTVHVRESGGGNLLPAAVPSPRRLRRGVAGGVDDAASARIFPLPPQDEDAAAFWDADAIAVLWDAIAGRRGLEAGGMTERMGRYLLQTLIGDALWRQIRAAYENLCETAPEGTSPPALEIALRWRADAPEIQRLSWEMLHDGKEFLAEQPGVALTRRIAAPGSPGLPPVEGRPRVLFVVGTEATDPVIRPGAEYLGLLRELKYANGQTRLATHLLLEANPSAVREALRWYRPTVVHLICHGGIDANQQPYLELRGDTDPKETVKLYAEGLLRLLGGDAGHRPHAVVLNVCQGGAWASAVSSPLSAKLVAEGVPVAVGMAGNMKDQACRLFTRRFYEALLHSSSSSSSSGGSPSGKTRLVGEPIAPAVAHGRRAGILGTGLTDPRTSMDWALPKLLLSDAAGDAQLRVTLPTWELSTESIASQYNPTKFPVFCGRLAALRWYDLLMADPGVQKPAGRRSDDLLLLGIDVPYPGDVSVAVGQSVVTGKVGASRLLREVAAQSVRDGHVPCLVNKEEWVSGQPPTELDALLIALQNAAERTADRFGIDASWRWRGIPYLQQQRERIKRGESPDPEPPASVGFPAELQDRYRSGDPFNADFVASVVRWNLLELREAVLEQRGENLQTSSSRLLLMFDDVHLMGAAAAYLLDQILGEKGMRHRTAAPYVRSIFVFRSHPSEDEKQKVAHQAILDTLNDHWIATVSLRAFVSPEEWRTAYEYHLLHWRDLSLKQDFPLMIKPGAAENNDPVLTSLLKSFLDQFHERVGGVPSQLEDLNSNLIVQVFRRLPAASSPLQDTDDLRALHAALPTAGEAQRN